MRKPACAVLLRCTIKLSAPLLLAPLLLSGCASVPDAMNPAHWWHSLEGGEIAQQRPPPPGANQPYPNLANVPARPAPVDQAALNKITQGLVSDRGDAARAAAAAPLADPSSPAASPQLFGGGMGALAPPGPPELNAPAKPNAPAQSAAASGHAGAGSNGGSTLSASLPAAAAPPPPRNPPPPARARVGAVTSEALVPPSISAAATPAMPAPPAIAAAPPAPPALSGPGAVVVPPTVPAPKPTPPAPLQPAASSVDVIFPPGSSVLPETAAAPLKALAAARGAGVIAVIAGGEAAGTSPAAQQAALSLGMARAQSVATVLRAAGVPQAGLRLSAQAGGRDASARLLQ